MAGEFEGLTECRRGRRAGRPDCQGLESPWEGRGSSGRAWRRGGWGKALGAKRRPELEPWKRRKSNRRRVGLGSDRPWETGEGTDEDKVWGPDLVTDGANPEMATQEEEQFWGSRRVRRGWRVSEGLGGGPRRAFRALERGILLSPGDAKNSWRRKFKVLQAPPGDCRHSSLALSYR